MTTDADRIALLTEHVDAMLEKVDERQQLIDAQAAQLAAARAQVAELSVTVEQLTDINAHMRQQLDKSNALILELNHRIVTLQEHEADLHEWIIAVPVQEICRRFKGNVLNREEFEKLSAWIDKVSQK